MLLGRERRKGINWVLQGVLPDWEVWFLAGLWLITGSWLKATGSGQRQFGVWVCRRLKPQGVVRKLPESKFHSLNESAFVENLPELPIDEVEVS